VCGFVGSIAAKGEISIGQVEAAMKTIAHRGPDAAGTAVLEFGDTEVSIGHKRLAIIDLSADSIQPMNSGPNFHLAYNGEIYNYVEIRSQLEDVGVVFRTNSDTEVLLEAWKLWGTDSLRRLDGIFSFCMVDLLTGSAFLVRDAFGVKPLYYMKVGNHLHFGSEPKAILALREGLAVPNQKSCLEFVLDGWHDRSNETFFDGLYQVLPGHYVEIGITDRSCNEVQWLDLKISKPTAANASEMICPDDLKKAVHLQMRSDVPIAFALSGGLDSTTLVAIAKGLVGAKSSIKTFGFIPEDPTLSEESWQLIASEHSDTDHTFVRQDPSDVRQQLQSQVRILGEPFSGTSILAQRLVFRQIGESGFKVSLDGQGADEVFGGYAGYPQAKVIEKLAYFDLIGAADIVRNHSKKACGRLSLLVETASELFGLSNPSRRLSKAIRFFALHFRILGSLKVLPSWALYSEKAKSMSTRNQFVSKPTRLARKLSEEIWVTSLPALLKVADRNSMVSSIESRVPYLSIDLVRKALSASLSRDASQSGKKMLLKKLVTTTVSPLILAREDKVGFVADGFDWALGSQSLWPEPYKALSQLPWIKLRKGEEMDAFLGRLPEAMRFRMLVLGIWLTNSFDTEQDKAADQIEDESRFE